MAKLLMTLIMLPITSLVNTFRALLQNSTSKNWLVTGEADWPGSALSRFDTGGAVHLFELDAAENYTNAADWIALTITVDGTEKIKIEHGAINLAPLYKTAETVYFKHLGEVVDGFAKGKFPSLAGMVGLVIDQNTPRIWSVPQGELVTADGAPVLKASIEPDQPAGDFGE